MKKFTKILSIALCFALVLSFAAVAFAADEATEVTIPEAIELAKEADGNKYIVSGTVSVVDNAKYGNMYIQDADGNKLYIYGLYSADGETRYDAMETKPVAGDQVVLLGELSTYNGEAQMKNARLQSHTPGENQEPDPVAVTIPEANTIGSGTGDSQYTTEKYIVTGVITEIANTTYGNAYIQDAEGNKLYIYGLYSADGSVRFDAMDPQPAVGDTVTVLGVLGNYKGSPQMKNGWVTSLTPGEKGEEPDPAEPIEVTIPEANTIGAAQEHNTYTEGKYIVTGTVCEISNTTYGNLYIQDAEGNKLFVYGLYDGTGTRFDKLDPQPKVGDVVTLEGVLGQYNGTAQMKNATMTYHSIVDNEEPPATDGPIEVTIAEAIAKAQAMEHNTYTEELYLVTGVIVEITNDTWGNMYIQDAEGNKLLLYGLYSADGETRYDAMETKPAVGDTVTVLGVLGQYNGNPQMKNAALSVHTPAGPSQTGDPIMLAMFSLLVSGGALAILPKKRS